MATFSWDTVVVSNFQLQIDQSCNYTAPGCCFLSNFLKSHHWHVMYLDNRENITIKSTFDLRFGMDQRDCVWSIVFLLLRHICELGNAFVKTGPWVSLRSEDLPARSLPFSIKKFTWPFYWVLLEISRVKYGKGEHCAHVFVQRGRWVECVWGIFWQLFRSKQQCSRFMFDKSRKEHKKTTVLGNLRRSPTSPRNC